MENPLGDRRVVSGPTSCGKPNQEAPTLTKWAAGSVCCERKNGGSKAPFCSNKLHAKWVVFHLSEPKTRRKWGTYVKVCLGLDIHFTTLTFETCYFGLHQAIKLEVACKLYRIKWRPTHFTDWKTVETSQSCIWRWHTPCACASHALAHISTCYFFSFRSLPRITVV